MNVEVLYFAEFKDITGKEKEKFDLPKSNLLGLLDILFERYKLKNIIWNDQNQQIHSSISIIINNQAIHEKNPSLIKLDEGDKIAFLLPVSGG